MKGVYPSQSACGNAKLSRRQQSLLELMRHGCALEPEPKSLPDLEKLERMGLAKRGNYGGHKRAFVLRENARSDFETLKTL